MKVHFETESGAQYTLDYADMTWERREGPDSTRTRAGTFLSTPLEIAVGNRVTILCPPLESGDYRKITTTPVKKLWTDVEAEEWPDPWEPDAAYAAAYAYACGYHD